MELREFAGQVLFSDNLEEKLRCPDVITDEHPGKPTVSPAMPGRPANLCFTAINSGENRLPGVRHLEDESERGWLLHFLANRELLATELLALVLLRFPDAPTAFREGVLKILKDEQTHTRMYIRRMEQWGVLFGDLPVSGFFWRAIAPTETLLDYVARLSLTFESANLDFCDHLSGAFQQVGDSATAGLLSHICQDEIGHVACGLQWFRKWKNPDESDWEAFRRGLAFPLSPERARGFTLNVEGRREAGFDPDFISHLEVLEQIKDRPPNVFVFNPFAEAYMAQGPAFTPVKAQALLAQDLAHLPQFLCRNEDVVLVRRRPSAEFLRQLAQAGFPSPEFVELPDGRIPSRHPLLDRKLNQLRPWAWGPDSLATLEPLFKNAVGEPSLPGNRVNPHVRELYSKGWSAGFLRDFLRHSAPEPWLCTEKEAGVTVSDAGAALEEIRRIRAGGHQRLVIKQGLGLAGHNAIRLWEPGLLDHQKAWIEKSTARGSVVIEPWLEREIDFSVQTEMTPEGLKVCGYTGLLNDQRGQFQGNWAEPDFPHRLPAAVASAIGQSPNILIQLRQMYQDILARLVKELQARRFTGPLGIDAFVYRASDGTRRVKPVVEINPRYTMGRLTLELMQRTSPGAFGWFRLMSLAQVRAQGFHDFVQFAEAMSCRFPLRHEGHPSPRIREGFLSLNDAREAQSVLATFQASRGEQR